MSIKYSIEPEAIKALREVGGLTSALSKAMQESPMMEYVRQIEEQNKLFRDQLNGISGGLSFQVPSYIKTMQEAAQAINPLLHRFTELQTPYQDLIREVQERNSIFRESFKSIHAFQATLDFSKIGQAFHGITDIIRSVPQEQFLKIRLYSERWPISDELLSLAVENDLYENTAVIQFVIDFYKVNDWQRLEMLVHSWLTVIQAERVKILLSVIKAVKNAKDEDVHDLTITTLIAQIDGLVRDLYSILPKDIRKRVEEEIRKDLPVVIHEKRPDVRKDVMVQTIAEVVDYWSAEMLQEAIYSGLFRDSNQISNDDNYSLFRHKIMHGDKEYLGYGSEENFIRLILYADFIIGLIRQIKDSDLPTDHVA